MRLASTFGPTGRLTTLSSSDSPQSTFAVREPFPSRYSQTNLVCGRLASEGRLRIRSLMAENGVIFSDGVEADRLDFNAGAEVTIGIAKRRGRLIV